MANKGQQRCRRHDYCIPQVRLHLGGTAFDNQHILHEYCSDCRKWGRTVSEASTHPVLSFLVTFSKDDGFGRYKSTSLILYRSQSSGETQRARVLIFDYLQLTELGRFLLD